MRIGLAIILVVLFSGCASAQTAIERRVIPNAELEFPAFAAHATASEVEVDNGPWRRFLATYVREQGGVALVDYGAVTAADRAALGGYVAMLEAVDPTALSSDDALAYWINLYNVVTVALILEEYPVDSIRDIKSGLFDFAGPWNDKRVTVNGEALSLNDIEHAIIRPLYDEPRIHYGVNCAAMGCPNLRADAFEGATLDAALDEQARIFINHPRGVSIDARGRITASKIFAWFREDFGDSEADIIDHIRQFAEPDLAERLDGETDIDRYRYDWALNAPPADGA